VIRYLKFWSATYFPLTANKAEAQDLFPDSRFKETKPQEEDFMWDLKLCGGIFVSFLLFYLLMHFNLIFTLDSFSNDKVGNTTKSAVANPMVYELFSLN
jgi:hypothetical protein